MGTIGRGTKGNGTTSWADGDTAVAAEFNTDFDTVYTLVNGNVDNDNVNGSANIDPSKIGDYSASVSEARTKTSPGVSGNESLPTTLEGELARIRYAIWQLATGTTAVHNDGAEEGLYYGDHPVRGANLVRNSSFEVKSSSTAGDAPDGWTLIGTPTSCAQVTTAVANGIGKAIRITSAAGSDGISQTFAGLKASTVYYVSARAKVSAGGDVLTISTTGGMTTGEFRNMSTAVTSTTFAQYSGYVQTDATPTSVVLRFVLTAAGDICDIDDVQFREVNADMVSPRVGYVAVTDSSTTTEALSTSMADRPSGDVIQGAVTVPGPGYSIRVSAHGSFISTAAAYANVYMKVVQNDGSTDTDFIGTVGGIVSNVSASSRVGSISMSRVFTSPVPGTTYTYRIQAAGTANTQINGTGDPGGGALTMESRINVELIPPG